MTPLVIKILPQDQFGQNKSKTDENGYILSSFLSEGRILTLRKPKL